MEPFADASVIDRRETIGENVGDLVGGSLLLAVALDVDDLFHAEPLVDEFLHISGSIRFRTLNRQIDVQNDGRRFFGV